MITLKTFSSVWLSIADTAFSGIPFYDMSGEETLTPRRFASVSKRRRLADKEDLVNSNQDSNAGVSINVIEEEMYALF